MIGESRGGSQPPPDFLEEQVQKGGGQRGSSLTNFPANIHIIQGGAPGR